jgi:hypothetical protein
MYQNDAQKVLTGECRLSYVNLVVPKAPMNNPNGKEKYSVALLIPKTDVATLEDIKRSIQATAEAVAPKLWNGVIPPGIFSIIHDGDGVKNNGTPYGDECKGHWVLNASTEQKPYVCEISNINCELAPQDIYSGMYARVTLRFYGFANSGNRGVGCGLRGVMKTREGEPLGAAPASASEFAGVGQEVAPTSPPAAAPTPGYTPAVSSPQGTYAGQINPVTGQPM